MRRSRPADERVPAAATSPRPRPTPYPRTAGDTLPAPAARPAPDPAAEADPVEPDTAVAREIAEEEVAEELAALGETVPPPAVDVWALVRQAQDGDAEAFGRLYDH